MNLYNMFVFLIGFIPVIGVLFTKIKINNKKWYIVFQLSFICVTVFYYLFGVQDKFLILTYGIFSILLLPLMTKKFGYKHFNKAIAVTMMLLYVLTEFWEIPIFISGYLGMFGKQYLTFYNQVYFIIVFSMLFKVSKFKFSQINNLYLLIPSALSFLMYLNFPSVNYASSMWYVSRIICFIFLSLGFYYGSTAE